MPQYNQPSLIPAMAGNDIILIWQTASGAVHTITYDNFVAGLGGGGGGGGGGGNPGGSAQQVQFNNAGVFGGIAGAVFDGTTLTLTSPSIITPIGLFKSDVGLTNVDNTSDLLKPISNATQAGLNAKASLASPAFTGFPVAPTASPGTNTTQIATTAFVAAALGAGGTVNSVSVVSANGFSGTVATATTTPAITITTSITGLLQGNGTAISAATVTGTGSVVLAIAPSFPTSITLGAAAGATGAINLAGLTSGSVKLSVADVAGTWTMKLPSTAGTNLYVLQTDGAGNTSWVAQSGGGGGGTGANPTASVGLSPVNGSATTFLRSDGAPALSQAIAPTWTGIHTFSPSLRSSGSAPYLTINAPSDTGLTAGSNAIGVSFVAAPDRQHASNTAIGSQTEFLFSAPTYSFASAGGVITNAATVSIAAAPLAGANAALTTTMALWLQNGRLGIGPSGAIGFLSHNGSGGLTINSVASQDISFNTTASSMRMGGASTDLTLSDSSTYQTWQGTTLNNGFFTQSVSGPYSGFSALCVNATPNVCLNASVASGAYGALGATPSGSGLTLRLQVYTGSAWVNSNGYIALYTSETQSNSARGCEVNFATTANGTTVRTVAMKILNSGQVAALMTTASTSSTTGALTVAGGAGVAGAFNVGGVSGFGIASSSTTWANYAIGTTAISSLRIGHGAAPTTPTNGDIWTTTAGMYVQINGATVGPLGAGGGGGSVANPTGTIGLTAVNGVATSAIRSDGAPALSQAIVPTWTGVHTFTPQVVLTGGASLPGGGTITGASGGVTLTSGSTTLIVNSGGLTVTSSSIAWVKTTVGGMLLTATTGCDLVLTDNNTYATWQALALTGAGLMVQRAGRGSEVAQLSVHTTPRCTFEGFVCGGSYGALSATPSGSTVGTVIAVRTYGGSTWVQSARMIIVTTEAHTESARGTQVQFVTTPTGSVTAQNSFLIDANGQINVQTNIASTTTTTGSLIVAGGVGLVGALNVGGNITLAGTLQLGNAYVATPGTSTGTVTIKDSTGTTYKVLVST